MIQLSAPTISANAAKPNAIAPLASPKGAEIDDFAALLGAAGSTVEMPEAGAADATAVLTAALTGLPDGKTGKFSGKTLPVAELAAADVAITDRAGSGTTVIGDLETNGAPDEAISDQADVPIAAAIPVLPLLVPPLPAAGVPAELRAAGPDTVSARTVALPGVLPEQGRPTAKPAALLAEAAPANAGENRLPPVRTTAVTPQTEGAAGKAVAMRVAVQTITAQGAAATLPTNSALPASLREAKLAPIATVKVLQQTGTVGNAAAMRIAAQTVAAAAPALPAVETPAHERSAALQAVPGNASAATAQATAPLVAGTATGTAAKGEETEPQASVIPDAIMDLPAEGGAELDRATLAMRSAAPHVSELPIAQPDAGVRTASTATSATATPAATEQPHDFATLVDRLSEAREAASPQVVRTALQHAEFGKISLQFRHDDANLSVTMASADPAFTSAVQGAVAATLAGSAAGGDQPQSDRQQPQQAQTSGQQQSATSGNGGQSQQQAAQARAEQGERGFHRAQGSSARAQQGDTSSSDRAETRARRSGIYA